MTHPTQSSAARPRLVKLVRDRVGKFLGDTAVSYGPVPEGQHADLLRGKLIEEAVEYLKDPSIEELADLYQVLCDLATVDLGLRDGIGDVAREAAHKVAERGGFGEGVGMYVQTTAPARFEGRHAA